MKFRIPAFFIIVFFCLQIQLVSAQGKSGYKIIKTFHIASAGGWDYIAVGPENRLYVSHGTQVNILDKNSGDSVGYIPNTTGVHGIAFIPALNKGYTSNGRLNSITVFDLKTNQVLSQIPVGENPDAIMYESFSRKIITCNGKSKDISIVDPSTEKVVATIAIGGKPETAVSDGKGKLYINNEDKNEIVVVDMKTNSVVNNWSIAPGEGPTGLVFDQANKRLYAGCDKLLMVIDAENGKVIDKLTIGDGCDGIGFDASRKLIFASCGEGVLSIIRVESANKYTVLDNVPTKRSARTIIVDEQTHNVYLPAADMEKPTDPKERPHMIPGTFQVMVLNK